MDDKVVFDDDQKVVLLKDLKELSYTSSQLHELVKNDFLSPVMANELPFLIESLFVDIAKQLNYESYLTKEKEARHAEIRIANETIRELKKKLGSQKPIDGLPEQLKHLYETVRDWWNKEGFNHISEYSFSPYGGLNLELHFMLYSRSNHSKTPVTDARNRKEHIQHLRDIGFEFADLETDSYNKLYLIDNPMNRKLLITMLQERFPSIEVHSFNNKSSHVTDDFLIQDVEATIYELSDI